MKSPSTGRRYRLLCPISRALDHLGDRWTLLILRDLHAGPARFKDLAAGITGLPSNILTTRLARLLHDGLVKKTINEYDISLYSLTELGEKTGPLLFELSQLGTYFPAEEETRPPGNLRLAAVTLKEALLRAPHESTFHIEFRINNEPFDIEVIKNTVQVSYRSATEPQAIISVPYEPMIAYADNQISIDAFRKQMLVEGDTTIAAQFFQRLHSAMSKDVK